MIIAIFPDASLTTCSAARHQCLEVGPKNATTEIYWPEPVLQATGLEVQPSEGPMLVYQMTSHLQSTGRE